MKQQKTLNRNKGITLIALVITIVVMLILVAVTISMAVNGGLFDYAGKAAGDTNNAILAEQQLANGGVEVDGTYYNSIDEYLNRNEDTTGETLVGLYKAGELKVGDYVDYNSAGATTVNPDNPENAANVAAGTLTGYTDETQSVAYEKLSWRVLGYDEIKNELLLISATPTTANGAIQFYGHVGYNNYENVLKTTCNKLYSNSSIGATARSITMADIDTYLGGSAVDKTKYVGGSTTEGGYGYRSDITSRFQMDESSNLSLVANEETVTLEDLTSTAYYYMVSDITGTMNQELLQGTNDLSPYYYWVASRTVRVLSSDARWCMGVVGAGSVNIYGDFCDSIGGEDGQVSCCLRPVVTLTSNVTTEQVPVLETAPTVSWNDPLGMYGE